MTAKIFKPARNAMQSGKGNTKIWVLEYQPEQPREIEPLMGYTSSSDMRSQIRLHFDTREQAEDYARRHGIAYRVHADAAPVVKKSSYTDNFRHDRRIPWTH
jgi:hypothetical protein